MSGDCFIMAVKVAEEFEGYGKVVHGLPVGQGARNKGRRFWHAWVEVEVPGPFGKRLTYVVDRANGRNFDLPRDSYYQIGQLDEEHVWRFDLDQANWQMLNQGHYGPWVDDWRRFEAHRFDPDSNTCACGGEVVVFEDGDDNGERGRGCEVSGLVFTKTTDLDEEEMAE